VKRARADPDEDEVPSKKAKVDEDDNTTSDNKADGEAKKMVSTRSLVIYRCSPVNV
jgi:hypothetical protein